MKNFLIGLAIGAAIALILKKAKKPIPDEVV
jgi:hypothetical protein